MNTDDYSLLNDPEMKEIFESFIVETREILDSLDLDLVELENRPDDKDLLNQIFRSFHTIKGTAGFLGLVKLQRVTHRCEDILNKLRKGDAVLTDDIIEGILAAYDTLKLLLSVIYDSKNEDLEVEDVVTQLDQIVASLEGGQQIQVKNIEAPKVEKAVEVLTTNNDNEATKKIDEIIEPETEPEEEIEGEPEEEEDFPDPALQIRNVTIPKAEPNAEKIIADTAAAAKIADQKISAAKKGDNSIRVDVERLDSLLNLVSELVLGRNSLTQISNEITVEYEGTKIARDLAETTRSIDLMTTDLHLAIMKTRMVKIGKVFNRFPRLLRDLSKEMGKQVQLIIKGEETELDKTLIDEIYDPLVHLVRNAIDHGVEMPEKREKLGKDKVGTVILAAEHEGNNILITIEDDGGGIDTDKLKEKAISKGLITKEAAAELSKQDAFGLIFLPGFSTAEIVTNVSGRGVGMDVVKTNVAKLRGIINIVSEVNKGSKFIIKLPLTLAIIQGLYVEINKEIIVIPLSSVIEVVRVPNNQIYHVNKVDCIKLRDNVLPLIDISDVLYNKKMNNQKGWQYIVIVGIAEKRYGIKVDHLIGQKEVVIKTLGNYLGNIEGVSGSTIMGDGTVVMIVDIAEMIHKLTE
ncbi:MAG: chemotaxis protein CheA [bacterium]